MAKDWHKDASSSILLSSLTAECRAELLSMAKRVGYAAHESIFLHSDPGDTLLLIETGRVEISVTSLSGRKSVLNHMGPGEALGEIALLDGKERSADATAATHTEGLLLRRADVNAFLEMRPMVMMALIRELCSKVRNASEMFATQAQTEAPARLARCLLKLAQKWGEPQTSGDVLLPKSFSQTDLGEFSGISRENVNRRLKQWDADEIIKIVPDGIILICPDMLEDIADV